MDLIMKGPYEKDASTFLLALEHPCAGLGPVNLKNGKYSKIEIDWLTFAQEYNRIRIAELLSDSFRIPR
jgi:hypothetical protein